MALVLHYFTELGSFRGALHERDLKYTSTFCHKNVAQKHICASEVTTIWRYTNMFIIIIVII